MPPETSVAGTPFSAARRAATQRRLAEQRLPIAATLAGDEPVRAGERGIEAEQVGDDLRAGAKLAAEQQQDEAQVPRRHPLRDDPARAPERRSPPAPQSARAGHRSPPPLPAHAFLRPEDGRRAALAAQRIVDVGHDRDMRLSQARIEAARVDAAPARRVPAGVGSTVRPSASTSFRPKPTSRPAPPSLVLLPPSPTMMRRMPASSSSLHQLAHAARAAPLDRHAQCPPASVRPTTCAISINAVSAAITP